MKPGSSRTGRFRCRPRRRCCTTHRRSSRGSRPTTPRTAGSRCSGRTRTPAGSSSRRSGWRCRSCPRRCSWRPSTSCSRSTARGCRPSPSPVSTFVRSCSPARSSSAYFAGGVKPVTIWLSEHYTRAAPGGTGAAKCGGNYASSLAPMAEAIAAGCDQVVFLDSVEQRWVDELGGMNVFFVYEDGSLVTPPLTGTILPGITRDSVITLAREMGHKVVERPYSIDEWRTDAASGELKEAFACGTAAVITPIGKVRSAGGEFTIADGGQVGVKLRDALLDIQHGRIEDRHGWVRRIG